MSENLENNMMEFEETNELIKVRRQKLKELQANGKDPFEIVKYDVTNSTSYIVENFETMEGKEVSIAGRIMSKREMGKASFCDIQDRDGRIQLYVRINDIGEKEYEETIENLTKTEINI